MSNKKSIAEKTYYESEIILWFLNLNMSHPLKYINIQEVTL